MHFLRRNRFSQLVLSSAALALLIGACGAGTSESVPVVPEDPTKVNVVVLFDRSGSTEKNGSRLGIERAIWPATFFPNLGRSYSLNVMPIGFSTEAEAWCDWMESDEKERVLSQDEGCKSKIQNIVNRPIGDGNTHFDVALKAAAEELAVAPQGRQYVLLVTDGEYTHAGGKKIRCPDGSQACQDLEDALNQLNGDRTTLCSIFVSTPASKVESTKTLEWLREVQNQNDSANSDWSQGGCPASTEIDLDREPWKLAEDIIVWYSEELAGLHVRSSDTDASGSTKVPVVVPNGAAQIALIGLKGSRNESVSFQSDECEVGAGITFESFYFAPIVSELTDGERCPEGRVDGKNLAPNENSLLTLFVPEQQELAACIPNEDGGGQLQLRSGFDALLEFNPRAVWVGPRGEVFDPNLAPEQYRDGSLFLNEGQASDLQGRDGWKIALDYESSVNPPGKLEAYSLLYESTVVQKETTGGFAARWPISPTLDSLPCAKLFERDLWQKNWLLFLTAAALAALFAARAIYKSQTADLSGELLIFDNSGTQTLSSHTISGGSPSWFNVGEQLRVEAGKQKDGSNWRLVWKKGATILLQQESGSAEDWSIGTPKMDRSMATVEFRRVPLSGSASVHTVRYIPNAGKVEQAIEKILEEDA
jgi:hypothetical protein